MSCARQRLIVAGPTRLPLRYPPDMDSASCRRQDRYLCFAPTAMRSRVTAGAIACSASPTLIKRPTSGASWAGSNSTLATVAAVRIGAHGTEDGGLRAMPRAVDPAEVMSFDIVGSRESVSSRSLP